MKGKIFDRSCEKLTTLEGFDLTGVTQIYCYNNSLTFIPALPDTVEEFDCTNNNLTSLPTLPRKLRELYCAGNKLTSLPKLPASLKVLICHDNNLTSLPFLPRDLVDLDCRNNKLHETRLDEILLQQHNQRRKDLGLSTGEKIWNDEDIRYRWMLLQYDLDGEEYKKAAREMEN